MNSGVWVAIGVAIFIAIYYGGKAARHKKDNDNK